MAAWAKTPGPVGSWAFLVAQEAAVVAVLAWFLLGPEELFRLSKALGSWLGEARGFVAETAAKYESSLDDASTRKAIAGIRETQRTVSEVASSFQAIATTVRDPLNLSSALSDTMAKYERKEEAPASGTSGAKQADKPSAQEETPEELERKIAASRDAAKDLWFKDQGDVDESQDVMARLEARLGKVDAMVDKLEALRGGILEDRAKVRALLEGTAEAAEDKGVATAMAGGASPAKTTAHNAA